MTALTAMPEAPLRSPTALVGVLAAHAALAWGLTQIALQPERLPEPIVVQLLQEALPEPDVQAQPLPQADAAPALRRVVRPPRPATVPQIAPPPPAVPEPVPAPPLPVPLAQPARSPVPPLLAHDTPPAPEPAADPVPPPSAPPPSALPSSAPAPVAQAPVEPAAAPIQDTPVAQPLFAADYLRNPKPRYPMMSRRMGEEGLVKLRVFVTSAGEPRQVELKESCGFPRLDQAALDVVRNWRFVPAKRGDSPVDSWVVVPIRFTLKG